MSDPRIEQLRALPRRPGETWQGGLVRLPGWIVEPGLKPYRPLGGMWVSLRTEVIHVGRLRTPEEAGPDQVLEALVELACNCELAGYRPSRLEVNNAAVAADLGPRLAALDIEVVCRERLLMVDRFLRELAAKAGPSADIASPLDPPGMTVERLRAFADAAAEFYRAAPWRHLEDIDIIRIETQVPDPTLRYACVLGRAGLEFGVGLYESPEDLWHIQRSEASSELMVPNRGLWMVTLDPINRIPLPDADLWLEHDLPLAADEAYPNAMFRRRGGRVRRPTLQVLSFLEGLLRALAATSEEEMDAGRWARQVSTFDGPRTIGLALPDLLDPPGHKTRMERGLPMDGRAMERAMWLIGRHLDRRTYASVEEAQAEIERRFLNTAVEELEFKPETPLEEAQDLCYRAYDSAGRRRLQLARQALATCPVCADAQVILAERSLDPQDAMKHYTLGVEAGERSLGRETLEKEAGHFWGIVPTRPYMRARFGLAQCLESFEKFQEAASHYQDMLRLDPQDHLGARYRLLPLLVRCARDAEAAALLEQFDEDDTACWNYGRAIVAYRSRPGAKESAALLDRALKDNPHVAQHLLGREVPLQNATNLSLRREDEAALVAPLLRPAWQASPGALDWLEARSGLRAAPAAPEA